MRSRVSRGSRAALGTYLALAAPTIYGTTNPPAPARTRAHALGPTRYRPRRRCCNGHQSASDSTPDRRATPHTRPPAPAHDAATAVSCVVERHGEFLHSKRKPLCRRPGVVVVVLLGELVPRASRAPRKGSRGGPGGSRQNELFRLSGRCGLRKGEPSRTRAYKRHGGATSTTSTRARRRCRGDSAGPGFPEQRFHTNLLSLHK